MKRITRISDGPCGERLWWFSDHDRIRRVPSAYSTSGDREYWVDHLPTPTIFFSRYTRYPTWREARRAMADSIGAQGG